MGENKLISPHRSETGNEISHDGRITTNEPNMM